MALKDVIGQEQAVGTLQGCVAKNRIPHALLFAGDEGVGKRLTAVNFAKTLNCNPSHPPLTKGGTRGGDLFLPADSNPQPPTPNPLIDSCDQCPSCIKIDKAGHPDVFFLEPQGDGDQIRVDAIRELEEALSYKPFEGNYKIAVIDNAEKMNQATANAFLDTLESPPSQSIIILVSSRPDMLLPTIRSRCRRISFTPLPVDTMSGLLKEKSKKLGNEQALLLSELSGGRLGYALNENLLKQRDTSFNILKRLLDGFEEEGLKDGQTIEEWFEWAQVWLRDTAVLKATGRSDLLINKDREGEIKALSEGAALKDILKLARELYNIRGYLKFNLNEKLTLNYTSLLMRKRLGKQDVGKR
ncbi:MAG: DNA polymerase III subunit delta' [Nitrospirae bacterium]|nr:DNA polymerase III subunit delta' [Nitrospirota bacterium]